MAKWIALGLLAGSLVFGQAFHAEAASTTVSVKLPDFPVTVDGLEIDSTKLKYPLLEYKGITYFPMTWNVGTGTGLRIEWEDTTGLRIEPNSFLKTKLEMEGGGSFFQGQSYPAQLAQFPITVNHKTVDNGSEPYPLLIFKDVTYFPMTWRFAVEDFYWTTAWDSATGLAIKTGQKDYLSAIIYNDEHYLYVYVNNTRGGMFRIPKDLEGMPELLTDEQQAAVQKARSAVNAASVTPRDHQTERKEDIVYYRGTELLSLKRYVEENRKFYEENPQYKASEGVGYSDHVYNLDEKTAIVSLTVSYLNHIPGPYTPYDDYLFIVQDGKAVQVKGFDQTISGMRRTEDGMWLWSYSPDDYSVRSAGDIGKVLRIDRDGGTTLWNDVLNAQYLNTLYADESGLLVQAYQLTAAEQTDPVKGFYWLRSDGSYEKVADLVGMEAYVDRNRELYVTDGINTITNVTRGQSKFWWDHDLWDATGHIENAGM